MRFRRSVSRCAIAAVLAAVIPFARAQSSPGAPDLPADDTPTVRLLSGGGGGRFEVVAEEGVEGVRLAELAGQAWLAWREPLGLPDRLQTSILVRLIPETRWAWGETFSRVSAEPGGVVTVWLRGGGERGLTRERRWLVGLAEGAWRRRAFLSGLPADAAPAPRWLILAAAESFLTAQRPALLDGWQAELMRPGRVLKLRAVLLGSSADGAEVISDEALAASGLAVWRWLRESDPRAWSRFTLALLKGESAGAALAREYGRLVSRAAEAREWELAWRVSVAREETARTTPVMAAAESRHRLEQLARIVVFDARTGREQVLAATGDWEMRREIWPARERETRMRILTAELSRVHPFYHNAAVSLGRIWQALARGKERDWREAVAAWEADFDAGLKLEAASTAMLDAAEAEVKRDQAAATSSSS